MTLLNPRWQIDGQPASAFVYGRKATLLVDAPFPGADVTFTLWSSSPVEPLQTLVANPGLGTPTSGAPGYRTVSVEMHLAHQWQVLERMPTTYSHYNVCCDAGSTQPFPTGSPFLADRVTNDRLYPPLYFTAFQPGQQAVSSPEMRRIGPRFMPGNRVDLLVDGPEIQTSVLAAINAAQHHIHLDWFFFDCQSRIAQALAAAARRGVQVRLLLDIPATMAPEPLGQGIPLVRFYEGVAALRDAHVEVVTSSLAGMPDRVTPPADPEYRDRLELHQAFIAKSVADGMLGTAQVWGHYTVPLRWFDGTELGEIGSFLSPLLLGGGRDHSKLIIVDGSIAFCGGANAQRYYIYDHPIDPARDATAEMNDSHTIEKWPKWHDCFVRYEGPAVQAAQRFFLERWAVCAGVELSRTSADLFPAVEPRGPATVKVVSNIPGLERDISAEYLKLLRNATQSIHVENPYLTDDLIATYMAHAAQVRGVPVELIVPDKYLDFGIARDLMKARWDSLRAAGVSLFAYDNHMLHVKAAMADGSTSIVSSYNFAKSSAVQLFEHGVVVDDAGFAAQMQQRLFGVDRPVSRPVTTSTAPNWADVKDSPLRLADRVV